MMLKFTARKFFFACACIGFFCGGVLLLFAENLPASGETATNDGNENSFVPDMDFEFYENSVGDMAESAAGENGGASLALRDGSDNLRLFLFEEEAFAVENSGGSDGGKIAVFSDGERFLRKFFDGQMRHVKTETWSMEEPPRVIGEEIFAYDENSGKISSATIKKTGSLQENLYDGGGNIVLAKVFKVKQAEGKADEIILETSERRKYSDGAKLTEIYFEKMDASGKRTVFSKREVFSYKNGAAENQPPDKEVYEDGKLRERKVFSSAEDYEATIFFDGGVEITEKYEDGVKVSEVFSQNGQAVRSKNYGQD